MDGFGLCGDETQRRARVARAQDRECNFFASIAADGKALFWDIVVKRDSKKREFLFTPTHKINLNRRELAGTLQAVRFNFSPDLRPGDRRTSLRRRWTARWRSATS